MSNPARSTRVLLVDDDEIFRSFLRETLEGLGVSDSQEAWDGHTASRILQSSATEVDLIVCDVFMPDMDGIEFLDFLVQQICRGKLTIVSSGDKMILEVARTLAVDSGLQLVGALPKEAVTPAMQGAILKFT